MCFLLFRSIGFDQTVNTKEDDASVSTLKAALNMSQQYFYIVSQLNGYVLDISAGKKGGRLMMYPCSSRGLKSAVEMG